MKAFLNLNLYDENLVFFYRKIAGVRYSSSSWVAEIFDFDTKYRYKRKFLPAKKDYRHANKNASEGVLAEYILESGHIYEVKHSITKYKTERYFCTVSDNGDVIKLTEKEVIDWLKNT